mmetsp:Transcript_10965/g.28484  ORF Transcript_10965/g.28484 Transcript_10965/m.28484 type:complete len:473 (-) Transcript_10965:153-1571(-)|eukprot:CAMPEP_0119413778 /NCGR_PEP_ID=MMETSP1335-20130426/5850_1 /TAXON_ID=259385 /ORGANISM="Chrysoculter rhomboideus, Strain RCC1486" /LENGTH=472 /DNA_ID=CAMNT_0007438595 /DNA_START=20 /DNA_END=1438 /DNA_ORIENTATION=+
MRTLDATPMRTLDATPDTPSALINGVPRIKVEYEVTGRASPKSPSFDDVALLSLACWLQDIGLPTEYVHLCARLLMNADLDPIECEVTERELERASISNPVYRRRIWLLSQSGSESDDDSLSDIDSISSSFSKRVQMPQERLRVRSPSAPVQLPKAIGSVRERYETIAAWTGETAKITSDDVHSRASFFPLAMPLFATRRLSDGDIDACSPRSVGATDACSLPTSCVPERTASPPPNTKWHAARTKSHRCWLTADQYLPQIGKLRLSGRVASEVRLPQDAQFCNTRKSAAFRQGSHPFVLVPGERRMRISAHAGQFGCAAGHPQLAAEKPVLFAGEVLIGTGGQLLAWCNMSGTYQTPRELAAQVDLPLELLWTLVPPDELSALAAEAAGTATDGRGTRSDGMACDDASPLPSRQELRRILDARFGPSNYLMLVGGQVLARDMARCPPHERLPLPVGSWVPDDPGTSAPDAQ